jgi:hypothetical protein
MEGQQVEVSVGDEDKVMDVFQVVLAEALGF